MRCRFFSRVAMALTAALVMGLPTAVLGQSEESVHHVTERIGQATMDWTFLTLRGSGRGDPDRNEATLAKARNGARREAEQNAYSNLQHSLAAVSINEHETVGLILNQQPALGSVVNKALREFQVKDLVYYSHGGMELEAEVPLASIIAKLVGKETPSGADHAGAASGRRSTYSGLIIDTQGLVFYPVLSPVLLGEDGMELYSAEKVKSDAIAKRGIVSYYLDMDEAKRSPRVGKNPLVVRALRLETRDSLVLPSAAARSLRESNFDLDFLEEGRVILVVPSYRPS